MNRIADMKLMCIRGSLVKNARLKLGMTQKELAAKLHVSARHIMYIENGRQKPSVNLFFGLIRALSLPADLLAYPDEIVSPEKYEYAAQILRHCGDKELDVVISTLQPLIENLQSHR